MTSYQATLTPADVTALLDAAKAAWRQAPGRARSARFTWRKKRFVAHHSTFRLFVDEANGQPVAYRYD